jgi:hypothetical protein
VGIIRRKPIIISIAFFLTILIGFIAVIFLNRSMTTSKDLPVEQFKNESNINNADIGNYISRNHDYWNEALCWGRSENFSFVVYEKRFKEYINDLNEIINAANDKDLKEDFIHAKELLETAHKTKDVSLLIDVHRIFHDLDVKYNGYASNDYFRITQYGEKH